MWLSDSKDVAFIRNHKLVCCAIKNTNPADTAAMITGSVKTMGKFSFQYGKIEVSLRTRKHIGNFLRHGFCLNLLANVHLMTEKLISLRLLMMKISLIIQRIINGQQRDIVLIPNSNLNITLT